MPYADTPIDVVAGSYYFLRAPVFMPSSSVCVCTDQAGVLYLQCYGASGPFGPEWALHAVNYRTPFELYGPGTQQNADDFIAGTFTEADVTALGSIELPLGLAWRGVWQAGTYQAGEVVRDAGWLMAAKRQTVERAAPSPTGSPFYISGLPDSPSWTDTSETSPFWMVGQRYTLTASGYLTGYRVWIPTDLQGDTRYEVWVIENPDTPEQVVTQIAAFPPGLPEGWFSVPGSPRLVGQGLVFELALVMYGQSQTRTWQAFYAYKQSGGTPGEGEINHQDNLTEMRIHYTDKDDVDREGSLRALGVGDTIQGGGIVWSITAVDQRGSHVRFQVQPAQRAPEGDYTFTFEELEETQIEYDYLSNYYHPGGSHPYKDQVQGFAAASLADAHANLNENAYGVDLSVQAAYLPADWDALAYTAD